MKYISYLIYIVILYIFLHNPIIKIMGDLGTIKLLYILPIVFAFKKSVRFLYFCKLFKNEMILMLLLTAFAFFRYVGGGEWNYVRVFIVTVVETFVIPYYIIYFSLRLGFDTSKKITKNLLVVGCIGAVISSLCVAVPSFNTFIRDRVLQIEITDSLFDSSYRGFGISEGLTYSYGVVQAIVLGLGIFTLKSNKWFIPFSFLIFISGAFNARTSIIIMSVAILVYAINNRSIGGFIFLTLIITMFFLFFEKLLFILNVDEQTIVWLGKFFEETDSIFANKSLAASDTTSALFIDMWIYPSTLIEWIIGTGENIYYSKIHNSDVGWIIQLNYGGILYLLLLYSLVIHILRKLLKKGDKMIALFFIISFMIANSKGPFIPNSGGWRLMIFVYYYIIMESNGVLSLFPKYTNKSN